MLKSALFFLALWNFKRSNGKDLEISKLIPYFLKHGKNGRDYCYKANISYGRSARDIPIFYFDAPYRIILQCYQGAIWVPIACISFHDTKFKTIRIQQIQGPSYSEDRPFTTAALAEIKWERLLVQIVCEWAKSKRIESVELISCKKSWWYSDHRHQQMFLRYDVTARRMGFHLSNKEEGVYKINTEELRPLAEAAV